MIPLSEVVRPGWCDEFRPEQTLTAVRAALAIEQGAQVVLIDGPPGIGKTLLADMVAQLLQMRMCYVAPHLILQDQFLRDFDQARILKGRANYPRGDDPNRTMWPARTCADCHKREYCDPREEGHCEYRDAKDAFQVAQVGVVNTAYWLTAASHLGMFNRLWTSVQPKDSEWKAVVIAKRFSRTDEWQAYGERGQRLDIEKVMPEPTHCDHCRRKQVRNYVVIAQDREGKRIQLGNNCLAQYRVWFPPALKEAVLPGVYGWHGDYLTVFDEADELERLLMNFLAVKIGKKTFEELDLPNAPRRNQAERWPKWLEKAVVPRVRRALAAAEYDANEPGAGAEETRRFNRLKRLLGSIARIDENWIYQPKGARGVVLKPANVAEFGKSTIGRWGLPCILQSATILRPEQRVADLGLSDLNWVYINAKSDWDPRRRPIYRYRTLNVVKEKPPQEEGKKRRKRADKPWKDQEFWGKLVAQVAWVALRYPTERTLVHTISYELADSLRESLTPILGDRVITYSSSATKDEALAKYLETPGAILLAPSMTRGVDLAGDACRNVIILKFPWPNLGDKQVKKRQEQDWRWYRLIAIAELVQAVGRGCRSASDWCRVWIMDSQFDRVWKSNKDWFPEWFRACMKHPRDLHDTISEVLEEEASFSEEAQELTLCSAGFSLVGP